MTLRNVLEELAGDVAPVDLGPRVERGVRRRRQRRVAAMAGATTLVLVAAVLTLTNPREQRAGLTNDPPAPAGTAYDLVYADDLHRVRAVVDGVDQPTEHVVRPRLRSHDLSADGRRLAIVNEDGTVEVIDLDGERRVIDLPPGDPQLEPIVAWAPDSRRLAVTATLLVAEPAAIMPDQMGVWIVDTRTGDVTTVDHPNSGRRLAWSPDGRHLALERTERSLPGGIDVVTLDGTLVRTLGRGRPWSLASNHAWSPDGTRLLVTSTGQGGNALLAVDATTEAEQVVADLGGHVWWRDAQHLSWLVDETSQVVEATLDGQVTRTVYTFPGTTGYPPGTVAVRPAS